MVMLGVTILIGIVLVLQRSAKSFSGPCMHSANAELNETERFVRP